MTLHLNACVDNMPVNLAVPSNHAIFFFCKIDLMPENQILMLENKKKLLLLKS